MQKQQLWAGLWLAGMTAAVVSQPAQAQVTQVTGVRLNPVADGFEVILETAGELAPDQIFTFQEDNTLIIDLPNTQLQLPSGEAFQQDNPAAGITTVLVDSLEANSVQIVVVGATVAPEGVVTATESGLVVQIPAVETVTTEPGESESAIAPEQPDQPMAESDQPAPETDTETDVEVDTDMDAAPAPEPSMDAGEPLRIVVTATRTEEDPTDVPRSVTVITREQLEQQTNVSRDLNDILAQLVPGLGPSSDRAFTAASLRGRNAAILIDGVPQNVNSRDFDRELQTIDPSAIERIEVVRGPSAIYGGEATGGIINIITRRATEDEVVLRSEIGVSAALGNLEGESFGTFLSQYFSARQGIADFTLSASLSNPGLAYDAEGDQIPIIQGTDGADNLNFLGKFGLNFDDNQRLQFSANHFQARRNTGIISDPIVDEIPGEQKARALDVGELAFPTGGGPQTDRNTVINLSYSHEDLFGSNVNALLYYRDNFSRSDPRDRRPGPFGIFQGELDSENWGARLGIDTPLSDTLSLLWGADYDQEETAITFNLFEPGAFDASNGQVNRRFESRALVPPYELDSLGIFAQLQWDVTDRLQLSGGARYETIGVSVDDYITIFDDFIEGGDQTLDDLLFNVGATYDVTDRVSLFASFAQGFSVPDFGLVLGFPDPGFSVGADVIANQPQKVNEFEVGIRGNWDTVQTSLAAFYNESDLGSAFEFNPDTGFFDILRAPERVYGLEATLDAQVSQAWALGGTVSWSEGEADLEDSGDYLPLSSARIQPIKLTAYVENQTTPGWRNRLQALLVGSRDRAFEDEIDPSPIASYLVLDFISSIDIGDGTLQIGIENLLDEQYFPAYSQRNAGFSETFNSAGRGRTVSVSYQFTW